MLEPDPNSQDVPKCFPPSKLKMVKFDVFWPKFSLLVLPAKIPRPQKKEMEKYIFFFFWGILGEKRLFFIQSGLPQYKMGEMLCVCVC